ncbi:MAG: hypothetical protein ACTHMV_13620 [Chitinophagaceae bacterium]
MFKGIDFRELIESIDWLFCAVLLLGGRYWGVKYFRIAKREAVNFLAFATTFGIIYLLLLSATQGVDKNKWVGLFVTYLFTTSLYEVLVQVLFERIEKFLGIKPNL